MVAIEDRPADARFANAGHGLGNAFPDQKWKAYPARHPHQQHDRYDRAESSSSEESDKAAANHNYDALRDDKAIA